MVSYTGQKCEAHPLGSLSIDACCPSIRRYIMKEDAERPSLRFALWFVHCLYFCAH